MSNAPHEPIQNSNKDSSSRIRIAVLGAGSWGTSLSLHLADQGYDVRLWARNQTQAEAIQTSRENTAYLPGFKLPDGLLATGDLRGALRDVDFVLCVVPSHSVRGLLDRGRHLFPTGAPICAAIKGIENESLKMVSEIFQEHIPAEQHRQLTFLGGPSFAREVAQKTPTAVCIAGFDDSVTERVQKLISNECVRAYRTNDVLGVELGGALKNVVAIAAGAADGLGFGLNTRAALMTRGLAEISRLAVHLGANPLTMMGLGGMGDLILTCTGSLSRNRTVGFELGKGRPLSEILNSMTMIAEGVRTSKSAFNLARREGVDMPIVGEVYQVLYEDKPPKKAMVDLMNRPLKHELA